MAKTTEFTIKQTSIPGLLEIGVTFVEDPRGWFQEKFQREKLVSQGFPVDFAPVQHNVSYNKETGVTRGIHAEPWDKYISVITGKIFAVFVDLRGGESFGKKYAVTVDNQTALFVPRGVANSFQTLEKDTYYTYLVNEHWSAENLGEYKFVNLADSNLGITWPIPLERSIISDKDKNHPMLKDIQPF